MANLKDQQTANIIIKQLHAGGITKLWSWGSHAYKHGADENQNSFLQFRVRGFLYKGLVRVTYNEGADLYTVSLVKKVTPKNTASSIKPFYLTSKSIDGIYCDQLTDIIDGLVEKDQTKGDAAYEANVKNYLNAGIKI